MSCSRPLGRLSRVLSPLNSAMADSTLLTGPCRFDISSEASADHEGENATVEEAGSRRTPRLRRWGFGACGRRPAVAQAASYRVSWRGRFGVGSVDGRLCAATG